MDGSIKKRIDIGAGEFILFLLILSEILEFTGVLPADLDYIKKMLSWVALGYLLYTVRITELIFGMRDKLIDALLICSYFFLVMKDFILYSKIAVEEIGSSSSLLIPFYTFILDNAFRLELITFYIGGGMIAFLALLNLFLNVDVKKPSMMAIIFDEGEARGIRGRAVRAAASFIIYCAFFVMVFNLMMEWLGWAVDSTLAVIGIFFCLFFFIKHSKRFNAESFLYKAGDFGEGFYERFIALFHSGRTALLGISGLLVLHLLTDMGSFILPYIIGKKVSYFVSLGAGHTVIPQLLSIDMGVAATATAKISVIAVYIFNIAAMLFLFLGPSFIWYEMYKERRIELPGIVYGLFFSSVFIFLVSPIFRIQRMNTEGLYGVDILTKTISVSGSMMAMSVAIIIMLVVSILCIKGLFRTIWRDAAVFCIEAFFAYYIYLFFADIISFYASSFLSISHYPVIFYLFIFTAITIFFYMGGVLNFIYTTIMDITKKFI